MVASNRKLTDFVPTATINTIVMCLHEAYAQVYHLVYCITGIISKRIHLLMIYNFLICSTTFAI